MKLKDWEILSLISGGIAFVSFINTLSFAVFGQVLAFCFGVGIIIVMFRRIILKTKRKFYEKKQAV